MMSNYHNYEYKHINTCKTCKKIYDEHGDTDAQIEDFHMILPINETDHPIEYVSDNETQLPSNYRDISTDSRLVNSPTSYSESTVSSDSFIATPVQMRIPRAADQLYAPRKRSSTRYHDFNYADVGKCKNCKAIVDMHGMEGRQPDNDFHKFSPIEKRRRRSSKKNRKSNKKSKKSGGKRKTQKRQHRKSAKN